MSAPPQKKDVVEVQYLEGGIFIFHSALDLGVLSLAGAGMGVDSGLPDFRGSTGLFKDKELAMSYEEQHLLFFRLGCWKSLRPTVVTP